MPPFQLKACVLAAPLLANPETVVPSEVSPVAKLALPFGGVVGRKPRPWKVVPCAATMLGVAIAKTPKSREAYPGGTVRRGDAIVINDGQQNLTPGVVHVPCEEKHWHGATHDSGFSHIALTAKGSTTTQVEE